MAAQTSGIRPAKTEELNWRGLNISLKNGITNFANDTLLFNPGQYQYPSMYNYNLLGVILEEAEKDAFQKVISKFVTDTLGLGNTVPDNLLITIPNRSAFYDRDVVAQTVNATSIDLRYRLSNDGYLSTAEDLMKLGNALMKSTVLSDSLKKRMLTRPIIEGDIPANYGNGIFFLQDNEGKDFFASRGKLIGGSAMLIIFPEEELVISMVANLTDDGEELPGLLIGSKFRSFLQAII